MGAQLSLLRYSTAWLSGSEAPLTLISLTLIKSMSDRFSRSISFKQKPTLESAFILNLSHNYAVFILNLPHIYVG